jgi:hypothetical protein
MLPHLQVLRIFWMEKPHLLAVIARLADMEETVINLILMDMKVVIKEIQC